MLIAFRRLGGVRVLSSMAALPLVLSAARSTTAGAVVVDHGRTSVLDALRAPTVLAVRAADPSGELAQLAVDGHEETAWSGRPGETQWKWAASFARPAHIRLVRARFGGSPTSGVPIAFHWETRPPAADGSACPAPSPAGDDAGWVTLPAAAQSAADAGAFLAQPTRRSWFVDAEACGLRLVIDRTNAGPPVVREVQAIEGALDVLRGADASDDGAYPGFSASGAVDGTYAGRWAGAPGRNHWALRVDLPAPAVVDRVRLVLGFDATSVPRPGVGRSYAVAWAPVRYVLEASEDGRRFWPVATEPLRTDGSVLPLRRRLVTFPEPRSVRALRLVMYGATGADGTPRSGAVPVVRELEAYRADDRRPIMAPLWILSVNANPAGESHRTPGGELTNDAYHAKFLQQRFAQLLPRLRSDDRYARALDAYGEPLDAPPSPDSGEVLESIEGDDPLLDAQLLAQSSPPPLAVLSGSNDWDYAWDTGPDPVLRGRWHWDPLRDARAGGMGQLATAVRGRVAPFMGFCGGAQILALLEARVGDPGLDVDQHIIDRILRRTSGRPIRGFAPPIDIVRDWPSDPQPRRGRIQFVPTDPLFADVAGPFGRDSTQSFPESHADAVRADAFLPGAPLQRFEIVAQSAFCGADVVSAGPHDDVFPNPSGAGWCHAVTEAFRSRDRAWPVIGSQFHAEQRDFATPAPGDPPESVADARLFLASAFEQVVDAYVRLAP